ncbi:N-6 DNA methylase [Aerococcaceae bacterium DSM 111176]|nr:N-6 DNA methylase [Aerococcaceae bacterium DSM 111176]
MNQIKLKTEETNDKLRGGYYTPSIITEFMVNQLFKESEFMNILEPSMGDGRFISTLKALDGNFKVTGIELFESEYQKVQDKVFNDDRFKLKNEDFYKFYRETDSHYDLIIGNPPYIRYQLLTAEQREIQSDILEKNGLKANKLINAWVAFTVAAIELLVPSGTLAFVLPTDILQVNYAKELRKLFSSVFTHLTIIQFKETVFDQLQQDVVIIIGKKKKNFFDDHAISIKNITSSNDLINININDLPVEPSTVTESLYKNDKWNLTLLEEEDRVFYESIKNSDKIIYFNNHIKGEVGITTGKNSIFSVSNETVLDYDLSDYTIPLLGRSVEANGIYYKPEDHEMNANNGKNVNLLDFNNKLLNFGAEKYIENIEELELHNGYKLSIRNKWYEVPSIWVPDGFLLRRIGSYPKILLNKTGATTTDTFHRLTFNSYYDKDLLIFLCYSSITLMSFELESRIFAGGALEILPGDLKNILIPKPHLEIYFDKNLLSELDNKLRNNDEIEHVVSWVDNIVIQLCRISPDTVHNSFCIWKELRENRLNKRK